MPRYRTFDISKAATEFLADGFDNIHRDETIERFLSQTKTESDRSVVLISAAFLDGLLEARLRRLFGKGNADARKKLFDYMGPFGTVSSKIEALFCLGDIGKDLRDDLHTIRSLRNACAHEWEQFQFNQRIDDEYLSRLKNHSLLQSMAGEGQSLPIHPRTKFTVVAIQLIVGLNVASNVANQSLDQSRRSGPYGVER